jgi:hypothetical protein
MNLSPLVVDELLMHALTCPNAMTWNFHGWKMTQDDGINLTDEWNNQIRFFLLNQMEIIFTLQHNKFIMLGSLVTPIAQ